MIRLLFLFIVLGAGLFVGSQYSGQQGYVLISIANSTIEMSVTTLVIFVIAALAVLFLLEYIIKKAFNASSATWNWFSVRKVKRSRRYTNEAIIKLLEGDFKQAEKKATRWVNHHDMPLLCYLVASEAAQGQGDTTKRDQYLEKAAQQENAQLAVELTRAKQQVRQGEFSPAFDTLSTLKNTAPNNPVVLNLLRSVYIELKLWQPLLDLLPKLEKNKLASAEEIEHLAAQAQCGLLAEVANKDGSEGLIAHWNSLPRKQKNNVILVERFVKQLIARKADNEAFTVVKESVKKHPNSALYALIPEMNLPDTHPAIAMLEKSLNKDGQNAEAHSALARLKMQNENWPSAQEHFEKALSIRSNVSDYSLLADVLEKQNLSKAAHEVSKKALTLTQSA